MHELLRPSLACAVLILIAPSPSYAEIKVAFFEIVDAQGVAVMLEPNGRFGHVAISYQGGWLHAYPNRGVEWMPRLKESRWLKVGEILVNKMRPELAQPEVEKYMGLPYDPTYSWKDSKSTYCSKFVAQLLGIGPGPMSFSTPYWAKTERLFREENLGISPDDIYLALRKRHYHSTSSPCEKTFKKLF